MLDGDGELTWGRAFSNRLRPYPLANVSHLSILSADPHLTAIGEEQARSAHAAWKRELLRGAPIPQRFYCSPLSRATRTLELTFESILPTHLKPLILEVIVALAFLARRLIYFQLRTAVKKLVNTLATSVGRGQKYNLSSPNLRSKKGLKRTTFCGPPSAKKTKAWRSVPNWFWIEYSKMIQMTSVWSLLTYPDQTLNSLHLDISVTAHSGWINAVLRVIGRKNCDLPTGGTCLRSLSSSRLRVLFFN